jgi:rubrerythrin
MGMASITKDTPLDQAWRVAIERETTAYEFYRQAVEVVADSSLKKLFEFLMKEEKRHKDLLEDEFEKVFTKEM